MILKGFKEKSNKKYLNKLLSQRQVNVAKGRVERLGVIVNIDEFTDLEQFKTLTKLLNLKENKVELIAFTNKKNKEDVNSRIKCYNAKDFGRRGVLKEKALTDFVNTPFDVLISYYAQNILELKLLTAQSKAKFKIGTLQADERINDLIIKTKTNEFNLFKNEVFKYLTILKK
ncbi:MAG: DUF6913 domain-containing protein [Flavobacteriaceae bacterium]